MLALEGLVRDTACADGTSALGIALGHGNLEIVRLMAQSQMFEESTSIPRTMVSYIQKLGSATERTMTTSR